MTAGSESAPVTACILFLRLRAAVAGAPQAAAGDPLAAMARAAVARWRAEPHLVLEAPAGLVVVANVTPSAALAAARRALAARGASRVGIGLHQGAVQATGEGAATRIAGDGLAAAAAVAAQADNTIVQSDAFRAALKGEPPRESTRRALLAGAGLLAVLAAGWGGRAARERYEALHRPAVLVFDVHPSGEVFVDGVAKGTVPPLERLPVAPGAHTIEVRHPRAKPLRLEVQLKPGQEMVIQHVFAVPPVRRPAPPPRRKPGPFERFKFWQ